MGLSTGIGRLYKSTKRARKERKQNAYQDFVQNAEMRRLDREARDEPLRQELLRKQLASGDLQLESARLNLKRDKRVDARDTPEMWAETQRRSKAEHDAKMAGYERQQVNAATDRDARAAALKAKGEAERYKIDKEITERNYKQIQDALTTARKKIQDTVRKDFSQNYDSAEYQAAAKIAKADFLRFTQSLGLSDKEALLQFNMAVKTDPTTDAETAAERLRRRSADIRSGNKPISPPRKDREPDKIYDVPSSILPPDPFNPRQK